MQVLPTNMGGRHHHICEPGYGSDSDSKVEGEFLSDEELKQIKILDQIVRRALAPTSRIRQQGLFPRYSPSEQVFHSPRYSNTQLKA